VRGQRIELSAEAVERFVTALGEDAGGRSLRNEAQHLPSRRLQHE
jgi:hypothetical protein